jgi:hypothetical protein
MLDSTELQYARFRYTKIPDIFERSFSREHVTYERHQNSAKELTYKRNVYLSAEQRAKYGGYVPKISIKRFPFRGNMEVLVLEFSVPKFLYGTSLYEFFACDMDALAEKVYRLLRNFGIILNPHEFVHGIVRKLDYCKNFLIPIPVCSEHVFRTLSNYQVKSVAQFNATNYANGNDGESVNYFLKSRNFRLYEKIAEIKANAVTQAEKDIVKAPPYHAVIRMELGFHHDYAAFKTIVSNARASLGLKVKDEYTVGDLFKLNISRRVLKTEWKQVVNPASVGLIEASKIDDDIALSMIRRESTSLAMALMADHIRRDTAKVGQKNAWKRFKAISDSVPTYYRNKKEIEDIFSRISLPPSKSYDILPAIKAQLDKFAMLRTPMAQAQLPNITAIPTPSPTAITTPPAPPTP